MVTLPHHYAFCKHMLLEITKKKSIVVLFLSKQMHAHTEGGGDAAFVHRVCQKPQKNERFLELLFPVSKYI